MPSLLATFDRRLECHAVTVCSVLLEPILTSDQHDEQTITKQTQLRMRLGGRIRMQLDDIEDSGRARILANKGHEPNFILSTALQTTP